MVTLTKVMCEHECMLKVIAKLDIHSKIMEFKMLTMLNKHKHFHSKIQQL